MNNPVFRCALNNPKITANLKVNALVSVSDIGNGKLAIYQDGVLLGEFYANQFENKVIEIPKSISSFEELEGSPYDNEALNQALSSKQNTLISGENIKTINNESILGAGNIEIRGGGGIPNLDGGDANSIYTIDQVVDGGDSSELIA